MLLKEVEIVDFKSIIHETVNISSNQLCFVGINESGKTNILEAMSYLNILDTSFKKGLISKSSNKYPNGYPSLSGVFELNSSDSKQLNELFVKFISDKELSIPVNIENAQLQLRRWGNGFENLSISIKTSNAYIPNILEEIDKQAEFLDTFFNTIYPIIEFYEDEELLIEPATIDELLGDDRMYETFRRLLYIGGCVELESLREEDNEALISYLHNISDSLNDIIQAHYKQDSSIKVLISVGLNNKLTLTIRDKTKKTFSIKERSPGLQYYFSFLINKIYLNQIHQGRSLVYLFDEPGYNLHPKGAKDLIKTFEQIAEKNQIFFTTHNPFLTLRNDIDSLLFVYKDAKNGTKINRKPFLNKYQILRKELGILLNDSFLLGDINLIVEGTTEKFFFHRLFTKEFEELEWLHIYNADGVTNIAHALNYLGKNNLNLSGIAVFDSDKEAREEKKKKGFISAMKEKNWSSVEINDAVNNDDKQRTIEDLFPQSLYIQAFNLYCKSLKDVGVFDSNFEDYPADKEIETPIIKVLETHFFSFINEDRRKDNSITKQDVMRIVLELIEKQEPSEQKKSLEFAIRLVTLIKEKLKTISSDAS